MFNPDDKIEYTGKNYSLQFNSCPKAFIRQDMNQEEITICDIIEGFVLAEKYKEYPNIPAALYELMKLFINVKKYREYETEVAVNYYYQKKNK